MNTHPKPTIMTRALRSLSQGLFHTAAALSGGAITLEGYAMRREWNATSDELYDRWLDDSINAIVARADEHNAPFKDYVLHDEQYRLDGDEHGR
jgi:hypothetical protein